MGLAFGLAPSLLVEFCNQSYTHAPANSKYPYIRFWSRLGTLWCGVLNCRLL